VDEQASRDNAIDRELRRALRDRSPGVPDAGHLDAEVAAAWIDRTLDATRAAAIESHLAHCADCQALLAVLARTEPVAAPSGTRSWWARVRSPWLIPVAAAATAVAIWVAVPSPPSRQDSMAFSTEAPPADSPRPTVPAPAPPATAGRLQSNLERRARAEPALREQKTAPTGTRQASQESDALQADAAAPERPEAAEALGKLADAAPAESAQPAQAPATAPAAAAARSAASDARERQEATARNAAPAAAGDALPLRRLETITPPVSVTAADGRARWQVIGSTATFAANAGAPPTPARVPSEAGALAAGSAPGGTVCWLVGRAGTVLLTTDGTRFVRVTAPAAVDLSGIQANDARTATVIAVDGRRFRTSDQGATWTALP